ncbi:MAG TPA: hypothetical protein VFQ77_00325 [Pseudonocardiaceae bacterium]|nr:hypothetical protein [Pseudonocardiaceae bacterium]
MTDWEIVLVLAGVPLAIMVLLGLLTLGPNFRRPPRYRPGQPWPYPPVWWTANPEALHAATTGHQNPPTSDGARGGCRGDW